MTVIASREGTHREYRWTLTQKELDDMTETYGDVVLSIFADSTGLYTERHASADISLDTLEARATSLIDKIHESENIARCEACGQLYNRSVNSRLYEQSLSWTDRHIFTHGMNPRYKTAETSERSETCVWTTGRIFDTLHIVTHLWETNPFFEDEELVNTESLVMCRGFERIREDGEARSYGELKEKYKELQRERPRGRNNREKRKDLLELLEWVLKREDRFYTSSRFELR